MFMILQQKCLSQVSMWTKITTRC